MSRQFFYVLEADQPLPRSALPAGYVVRTWRPRRDGPTARHVPLIPNVFWWLFDRFGIFANRSAGVLMILAGDTLVHRSLVTPRWFRFPGMGRQDLQIGDTWTHPDHRGRGLAKAAIAAIHQAWTQEFRCMWYLVDESNQASVRVIEACGYRYIGAGDRTRPWGIRALGQFVMTHERR